MNKTNNLGKVIQDMSLLYELALATGQSLDLKESCDIFLKRLMGRKNLMYSAVWIKDNYLTGKEHQRTATLIYAFPEYFPKTKKLPVDHPLFAGLKEKKYIKVSSDEEEFWELVDEKGITNGTFVLVSLDEIGVLKLFSMRDDCFSNYELNQLRKVVSKFAYSLKGCLFHKQLLREIAERKRAEEALKQSEQQMADIINFLPDATFAINLEGKVISWNRAIETMTGIKAEEMLGKGNYEYALPFWNDRRPILIDLVLKPELKESFKRENYLFLQRFEDNSIIGEVYLPALRGRGAYLWAKATPLFDLRGKVIGAIESLRDITGSKRIQKELEKARIELEKRVQKRTVELAEANEALRAEIADRKRVEAALAEEKELLSVTLHSIGDGVITTDTRGNVSSINRVAEDITGWKQVEVQGKPLAHIFQLVIDERMSEICENPLEKVLQSNKEKDVTDPIKIIAKNKTRKIISANAAPIRDKKQNIVGYVITFRDITEQKKVEAQLALSQKLQSIGELAAGIAHEINTPMQYIGDNTRFLQNAINDLIYGLLENYKQLKNKLEAEKILGLLVDQITRKEEELDVTYLLEEIPRAFKETLEGIEKVNKLVLAMKDFAHPGKKEMKFANINKAIEGTVTISRNEWKYVAELETNLEPGLPLVCCVIDEINQVLLNMIVNAAQAIKEAHNNGSLTKGKITVTTKKDGDYVNILLSDNGTGIPKEMIDKIFDPFFTTKEVGKGTGQGLAIAHDIIVTKHKGSIEVDSEEGKGTVFTIRLPINPQNNTG